MAEFDPAVEHARHFGMPVRLLMNITSPTVSV